MDVAQIGRWWLDEVRIDERAGRLCRELDRRGVDRAVLAQIAWLSPTDAVLYANELLALDDATLRRVRA